MEPLQLTPSAPTVQERTESREFGELDLERQWDALIERRDGVWRMFSSVR